MSEVKSAVTLVAERQRLIEATNKAITGLLEERDTVVANADKRVKEIGEELKSLGYKKPRERKQAEVPPTE